jgi:hypothetical protein
MPPSANSGLTRGRICLGWKAPLNVTRLECVFTVSLQINFVTASFEGNKGGRCKHVPETFAFLHLLVIFRLIPALAYPLEGNLRSQKS